jgi:hypothetical protein
VESVFGGCFFLDINRPAVQGAAMRLSVNGYNLICFSHFFGLWVLVVNWILGLFACYRGFWGCIKHF